jgi:hypothetical protein
MDHDKYFLSGNKTHKSVLRASRGRYKTEGWDVGCVRGSGGQGRWRETYREKENDRLT